MPFRLTITPEAKEQIQAIMDDAARAGLQKQLKKAFGFLSANPKHPGLNSHPLGGAEKSLRCEGLDILRAKTERLKPIVFFGPMERGRTEIVILSVIPHY